MSHNKKNNYSSLQIIFKNYPLMLITDIMKVDFLQIRTTAFEDSISLEIYATILKCSQQFFKS